MNCKKSPELLAPAGNASCALAAFDAGADAVYCGLKQFNARERTENFTDEDMDKIIGYAHRNGKKVYVTLNTLIKESELPELGETLALLERLGPDALIVQDSGVLYAVRNCFPTLRVHASTQMGLHNSAGLVFAEQLGIKRVILERQTTIDELELMMKNKPAGVETEMFIHGALCCCVSGSCLLSSWLGGWSGNRGKCKQPCRRRYHSKEGNGFFLSAQDLCTIDILPRILRTGVASLKIEGRLRRSDYVEHTVHAYRIALNAAMDSEEAFRAVLPEAKEELAKSCGRKWSKGFYTPDSARELIKYDSLGASGLLCGKVLSTAANGFTFSASKRIHLGDLIRVQPRSGDEGPAISVTRMSRGGESVRSVRPGETVFIHSDKEVPEGALVYKTGESVTDSTKRIAALPLQKEHISLEIAIDRTRMEIRACGLRWEKELSLVEAGKHPLTEDRLEEEFTSGAYEKFDVRGVTATICGNPFLPASVLKALRLEFRDWIAEHFQESGTMKNKSAEHLKEFQTLTAQIPDSVPHSDMRSVILPRGRRCPPGAHWRVIREINDDPEADEELLLPFFIPETRLMKVRSAIDRYYQKGGRVFRIASVHHTALLRDYPGAVLHTVMPLPVCNSLAVKQLAELGVRAVQLWLELEKKELEALAEHTVLPAELYRYGRPVLLTTRANIPSEGELTDARGMVFRVKRDGFLTRLTSEKVFEIPSVRGVNAELWDLRNAEYGERDTATFNFDYELR